MPNLSAKTDIVLGVMLDSPTPIKNLGIASCTKFFAKPDKAVKKLQIITPQPIILDLLKRSAKEPTKIPEIVYIRVNIIPVSKPNSAFVRLRAGIISSEKAIRKCLSAIFRIFSTVTKSRK